MKPVFALLILAAVLLAACNLPFGSESTDPTAPVAVDPAAPNALAPALSTPASVIFMPQQMRDGAAQEVPPPVAYFLAGCHSPGYGGHDRPVLRG